MSFPEPFGTEMEQLRVQYGEPVVKHVIIGALFQPRRDLRIAEVCMVVRRPSGNIVLMCKTFYPEGIFRLFTGGIMQDEPILMAFHRELYEETGISDVTPRFLTAIAYHSISLDEEPDFMTFAFLVDNEERAIIPTDPHEHIEELREVPQSELLAVAEQLGSLPHIFKDNISYLDEWGKWRSFAHAIIATSL